MKPARPLLWLACAIASVTLLLAPATEVQAQQASAWQANAPFSQQELDQMLAPIALYPDALLAQVLMASTYPLEVVQAARFMQRNPGLSGDTLARAVAPMGWDPSVAALTQFPSVLAMMNEELDWTQRLGEAFLAQREQVMETVQVLRAKAYAAGSLRPNDYQNVVVRESVIVIETWRPGGYWVPYYNPLIVYGGWWWPAYQPFLWVPPLIYRPPYFAQVYSVGIVWGPFTVVWSSLWNDPVPVWRDRYVVYDGLRVTNLIVTDARAPRPLVWQHDPDHRRNVEYRAPVLRDQYPAAFPQKPSRTSSSIRPAREPAIQAPREPGVQVPREPGMQVPRDRVPEAGAAPRQQAPAKPPAAMPQQQAPRQIEGPQQQVPRQQQAPGRQQVPQQQAPQPQVPRAAPAVREPALRQQAPAQQQMQSQPRFQSQPQMQPQMQRQPQMRPPPQAQPMPPIQSQPRMQSQPQMQPQREIRQGGQPAGGSPRQSSQPMQSPHR